jgi:hypothetical protein
MFCWFASLLNNLTCKFRERHLLCGKDWTYLGVWERTGSVVKSPELSSAFWDYVVMIVCCHFFIIGNRKMGFIRLLQSQNNGMKICVHWKPCFIVWKTSWEVWKPAGIALCVVLTVRFPPPHFYLSNMWIELNMLSPEERFLGTHCHCHSALWHTGSHRIIIIIISNIIPLLHPTLRKSKLAPFLLSPCLFLVRSLDFLELFFNFLFECLWPSLMQSSLLPGNHKNHLIWVGSSLMAPHELA